MNLDEIKDILRTLDESDIVEFELEQEGVKLRVRKKVEAPPVAPALPVALSGGHPTSHTHSVSFAAPAPAPPPSGATGPTPTEPHAAEPADDGLVVVRSPIVGTFYRTPDPNSPPFVEIGDRVREGQVICIIEAMKLMNEIEAELAGSIVKIHRDAGQAVQYGDPLFSIDPD